MFALNERLTHFEIKDHLARWEKAGISTTIDASALRHFDSSAIAYLLECRRVLARSGKSLQLVGLPQGIKTLAMLYGVTELLNINP